MQVRHSCITNTGQKSWIWAQKSLPSLSLLQKLQVVANEEDGEIASVTVLNVDTVTQVKNKILDHLNRGRPYSSRPVASDMDLGKWG